jgi:hypothetical protein
MSERQAAVQEPPQAAGADTVRAATAEVVRAAKARIVELFDLAGAEARLAAISGLTMLACVIVAAAALVIAWMLLVALAIYLLMAVGIAWPAAASALAIVHVAIAYMLWRATVRLSRNLTLPELRNAIAAVGTRARPESQYVQAEGTEAGGPV